MRRSLLRSRSFALALVLGLSLSGCDAVGDQTVVQIEALGEVAGFLFIDLDGNGQPGPGDDSVEGWQVRLEQPAGGVLATAVTDTAGEFSFSDVPVGRVVFKVNEVMLGDTVQSFGVAFAPVTLALGDTIVLQPGVSYPMRTVSQARASALGKPLFTRGVALNAVNAAVNTLHVQDVSDGKVIRVTDLLGTPVLAGDTVRVRGRVAQEAEQPFLRLGAVFVLGAAATVVEPTEVTTDDADDAKNGTLDGAFVQVRDAEILEVEDLDENGVRVVVDDGSGELEVHFRPFLGVNPLDIDPEALVLTRARGLLVPRSVSGVTRWSLQPRTGADFRFDLAGAAPPVR
jgi:hypothetical protein